MGSRTSIQILAGIAALMLGVATGLPFRTGTVDTPEPTKREAQFPRVVGVDSMTPEEGAITILKSNDPETLKRAFDRSLKSRYKFRGNFSRLIAQRWAETDAAGMYEHLMATGGLSRQPTGEEHAYGYAGIVFGEWVKQDREAAIAASLEFARHKQFADPSGLKTIGTYLIANDPDRARALAEQEPDAFVRSNRYGFQSAQDRAAYMDVWASLEPSREQSEALGENVFHWLLRDHRDETWPWLSAQEDEVKGRVFEHLTTRWGGRLPAEMFAALQEHVTRNPDLGANFSSIYAEQLIASSGFEEALAWASESLRGAGRQAALAALFAKARNAELDQVVGAYESLPPGNLKDSASPAIVARMAKDGDSLGALEWINQQEFRSQGRERALKTWVYEFSRWNPNGAADFINASPESAEGTQLLEAVISHMAFKEGGGPIPLDKGLNWLEQLEDETQAVQAASSIFRGYGARGDLQAARASAEAITRPAVRDAAIEAVEKLEVRAQQK